MLFEKDYRSGSAEQRRKYAIYEIAYTLVDFLAASFFIVGSVFFFFSNLVIAGTWLFLIGSFLFAVKPTIRLVADLRLAAMDDQADLAKKYEA